MDKINKFEPKGLDNVEVNDLQILIDDANLEQLEKIKAYCELRKVRICNNLFEKNLINEMIYAKKK